MKTELNLRDESECRYDALSLGEVMLRLDLGEGRIRTARQFRAWEGGGEYNVIRGLRRYFGLRTGVITAFADNEVGMLMEDCLMKTGDAEIAVNYGAAHGALAMTTPGDTTMASKKEVEALINGIGARVQR